jgi:hypothetical protein
VRDGSFDATFGTVTGIDTVGVPLSVATLGTVTGIDTVGVSLSAAAFGTVAGIETVGVSLSAAAFGTVTGIETVGVSLSAAAFGTVTGIETVGVSLSVAAFGTVTGIETVGVSLGVDGSMGVATFGTVTGETVGVCLGDTVGVSLGVTSGVSLGVTVGDSSLVTAFETVTGVETTGDSFEIPFSAITSTFFATVGVKDDVTSFKLTGSTSSFGVASFVATVSLFLLINDSLDFPLGMSFSHCTTAIGNLDGRVDTTGVFTSLTGRAAVFVAEQQLNITISDDVFPMK